METEELTKLTELAELTELTDLTELTELNELTELTLSEEARLDGPGQSLVYRQLHDGDIDQQYYLYRWNMNAVCKPTKNPVSSTI